MKQYGKVIMTDENSREEKSRHGTNSTRTRDIHSNMMIGDCLHLGAICRIDPNPWKMSGIFSRITLKHFLGTHDERDFHGNV